MAKREASNRPPGIDTGITSCGIQDGKAAIRSCAGSISVTLSPINACSRRAPPEKALGHEIKMAEMPHGGGQAILLNGNGVLMAGSDPRKDGCALAY